MSPRIPARAKRWQRMLSLGSAGVVVSLVAAYLTFFSGPGAKAAADPTPSSGEAAAGLIALSQSYPGGLPALLGLFDTGECAGIDSLQSAPPQCQSILDEIAQLGAGQSFPGRIPDLAGSTDQTVPPDQPPDSSDQVTPDMLAEMQAQGAPADLIAGLSQNPPVLPPAYNTLPFYQGGPPPSFARAQAVIPQPPDSPTGGPSATRTTPPVSTPPTGTPTTDPATTTDPPTTTDPSTTDTSPTDTTIETTEPTTDPSTTDTTTPTETPTDTSTTTDTPTTTTDPSTTDTSTTDTTEPTTETTDTTPPPPPPPPPLLVAVGDSVTSGHEARAGGLVWRTTCDDPGTGPAAPGSSWAGNLRALLAVPWNRYFNFAHSGSATTDVLATVPYTNPCGVVSQPVRAQIADAAAVLAANPSRAGAANVAVVTAGVNDTNWTAVATQLVSRRLGGAIGRLFGAAPAWSVANPGACTDWAFGNPAGNPTPGAPPGAIPPAWNGAAASGGIAAGAASISLQLIGADPGAQVRHLLYYRWIGDPNLPNVCNPAAIRAATMINGWIGFGILVAKVVWAFLGGNPNRIQAACQLLWNPGPANIQTRLISFGIANWALVPGYPHPNAAGRAALAGCVNASLPRAAGGGVA